MTYPQLRGEIEILMGQDGHDAGHIMTAIDTYLEEKAMEVEHEIADEADDCWNSALRKSIVIIRSKE
jgi:hypothetical protein